MNSTPGWLPPLMVLVAFISGSLPFSVWLSRLTHRQDVRGIGDGNPGATNALRLGGWRLGLAVLLLDVAKGALPVGLAFVVFELRGPWLLAAAFAPSLGHGFSPFLKFRGGKALAVALGAWIGLTLGELPIIILLFLVLWFAVLTVDGWAVLLTAGGMLAHLLLNHPDPVLLQLALAQTLFVIWKHRQDLARRPDIRPWALRLVRRFLPRRARS